MTYTETVIPGVWIIEPKVLKDARGYFMEAFKQAEFGDLKAWSRGNTLRHLGFHRPHR